LKKPFACSTKVSCRNLSTAQRASATDSPPGVAGEWPMKMIDALIDSLAGTGTPVTDVCTGAYWTTVTARHTGLAATYRDLDPQHSDHGTSIEDAGRMIGKTAGELTLLARSENTVAAAIGVAAINSMIEIDEQACVEASAFDLLAAKSKGVDVAVVGHFPFIPKLRETARNVFVIEKRLRPGDLPEEEAENVLPRCQVVCLTGTALINHTLEGLLELCKGAYVVLTGPSSPLTPVLFEFGIHAICGARVTNPAEVRRYITQGASFRQVRRCGVRLLTMRR
jgi:uncharacterized protein